MSERRPLVLVVDDEVAYREALTVLLSEEGFDVETASDGVEAMERFAASTPSLILLDVMLPRRSGIDVCREIRQHSDVPIIMVSARDAEIDTVVGLEVGADDYIAKPFRSRELIARVRVAVRRGQGDRPVPKVITDEAGREDVLVEGGIRIDVARHEVLVNGAVVHLPRKEFDLLELLMFNAGIVLTRDQLIDRVWGHDYYGDTKTLDVHVKRLRSKVEVDGQRRITTVRGVGYRFERADR